RPGDERELRSDDDHGEGQRGERLTAGRPAGVVRADEGDRIDGSGDAERRERGNGGAPRRGRAELGGELVREVAGRSEPRLRLRVGPQMVVDLGDDPPGRTSTDPDQRELAPQHVDVRHATTAFTAPEN